MERKQWKMNFELTVYVYHLEIILGKLMIFWQTIRIEHKYIK